MGEVVRRILVRLADNKVLFHSFDREGLLFTSGFSTAFVSQMLT